MAEQVTPLNMEFPVVPRVPLDFPANKYDASRADIDRLKYATEGSIATDYSILTWTTRVTCGAWDSFVPDPILALLTVVRIDTKAFLQKLESALDEISQDSLDEYLMSRRLTSWRKLMSHFEIEVPAIELNLRSFCEHIFGLDLDQTQKMAQLSGRTSPDTTLPPEIQAILDDVAIDIKRVEKRLDEAYTALRADMQFAESHRSIAETKSVTKLTELAFIFIPLSFTCSLFSMSIRELQHGVPVWTFILTAVIIALVSYAVRLVVASDFIADNSRRALEKFWARRNVQRGQNAPIFTLIGLTIREILNHGGFSVVIGVISTAFIVIPIAFLWTTTQLGLSFNITMTLFLLSSGLACAWFVLLMETERPDVGISAFIRRRTYASSDTSSDA